MAAERQEDIGGDRPPAADATAGREEEAAAGVATTEERVGGAAAGAAPTDTDKKKEEENSILIHLAIFLRCCVICFLVCFIFVPVFIVHTADQTKIILVRIHCKKKVELRGTTEYCDTAPLIYKNLFPFSMTVGCTRKNTNRTLIFMVHNDKI